MTNIIINQVMISFKFVVMVCGLRASYQWKDSIIQCLLLMCSFNVNSYFVDAEWRLLWKNTVIVIISTVHIIYWCTSTLFPMVWVCVGYIRSYHSILHGCNNSHDKNYFTICVQLCLLCISYINLPHGENCTCLVECTNILYYNSENLIYWIWSYYKNSN